MARTKRDALERQAENTPPRRESRRAYSSNSSGEYSGKNRIEVTSQQVVIKKSSIEGPTKPSTEIERPEVG